MLLSNQARKLRYLTGLNPKIFHAYDVRGKYPQQINEDSAFRLGYFLPRVLRRGQKKIKIVVAADSRPSSSVLKCRLIDGLRQNRVVVIDAGEIATPILYFAVKKTEANLGIMITGSHLAQNRNGFKICRPDLQIISGMELKKYLPIFNQPIVFSEATSRCQKKDFINDYANFILSKAVFSPKDIAYLKKIKIKVARSSKPVSLVLKKISKKSSLPIKFVARPSKTASGLTIAFDSDADRFFVFDNFNKLILGDIIGAILTDCLLRNNPGESIIVDERSTSLISEIAKKRRDKIFYSRVGHSFFKKAMRQHQARLGIEKLGHYYWKELLYVDDGIFTFLKFLKCLAQNRKKFADLIKNYRKYATLPEQNFKNNNWKNKMDRIKKFFKKSCRRLSLFDGLTMEFDRWRFNLRPSQTEPFLRLNIEAASKEILREKFDALKRFLKN